MKSGQLRSALTKAGLIRLAKRAAEGEFDDPGVHVHPRVALENALSVMAATDYKARAMLVRVRRGEFD